ncbi:MAG: FHA domain-containing protein [Anaerolineae bacterium]|nr:FHA domain-containing protein [Anaerolineae bacterium]
MKEKLDIIESRLQKFIEHSTARLFAAIDVEASLATRLVDALHAELKITNNGEIIAPDRYTIAVNPRYIQDVRSNRKMLENLEATLNSAIHDAGIELSSPPRIMIVPDPGLNTGEFKIRTQRTEEPLSETSTMQTAPNNNGTTAPRNAFLIVDGSKVFPLESNVVNIGRKLENQLVINDPRISRKHAQLRATKGQYTLFDLDSTGGTSVNGDRISQIVLHPGDVISLAGIALVYGQDAIQDIGDTKEYSPPNHSDEVKVTAPLDPKVLNRGKTGK